jgi:hypothetical protein
MRSLKSGRSIAVLSFFIFGALFLSSCCHGQWCFGPAASTTPSHTPPPTNTDDRTNSVDPRTAH